MKHRRRAPGEAELGALSAPAVKIELAAAPGTPRRVGNRDARKRARTISWRKRRAQPKRRRRISERCRSGTSPTSIRRWTRRRSKRDLERAAEASRAFEERYKGKLKPRSIAGSRRRRSPRRAIAEFEKIEEILGRLGSYAGLVYSGDTSDPARAKFYGDLQDRLTTISTHLLFFGLELNRLDDAAIEKALETPALAVYRPWIEDLRLERPYQLEDRIEQLFHEKSVTGRGAWNRLFDETLATLRFDVEGEKLPLEPTLNRLVDPDEERRKHAAEALAATFKENLRLFTHITNVLAKDKSISDEWRGFKDVAAARHLSNRVEPEVVDALVAAVHDAYPQLSHRYYALKAALARQGPARPLGPQRAAPKRSTGVSAGRRRAARCSRPTAHFAPEMAAIAERFFERSWIDAPTRPGKAPGAFAHPTVPSVHPYVLLNYQGKTRDVMTLAHELGHGVHQVLAADQGLLMSQTPLTLAETASVFGEMLTFRAMLDAAKDKRERKIMLAAKVEDMLNTVVRQIAFYTFERLVHLERREGELTSERLGEIWLKVQSESLGPAIRLGPGYETFWSYIPHFIHSPFYVYAYAFGDCLVNSLYAVYEKAESGFQEKYFAMLKAGGTKQPQGAPRALRPRRERPRLLADGPFGDRRPDLRAGGGGELTLADAYASPLPLIFSAAAGGMRRRALHRRQISFQYYPQSHRAWGRTMAGAENRPRRIGRDRARSSSGARCCRRELDAINERIEDAERATLRAQQAGNRAPDRRRRRASSGLALSGGGVRSAAFSLGALQALNHYGVIDNIHYLSTVSGGGYAGGAMVASMSKTGEFAFGATKKPRRSPAADVADTAAVGHLRNYSNFLIPFGLRDVLTSVAIVLRGIIANVGSVIPVLLLAAAVTIFANPTVADLTLADVLGQSLPWIPFPHFGLSIVVALAGLALFFLWALYRSFLPQDQRSEFRTYQRRVKSGWQRTAGWLPGIAAVYLVLTAIVVFAEFQSFVLSEMFSATDAAAAKGGVLVLAVSNWVQILATLTAPIAAVVMFFRKQFGDMARDTAERSGIRAILVVVFAKAAVWVAGAALPLILWVVYLYLAYWGIQYTPKVVPPEPACQAQEVSGDIAVNLVGQSISGELTGKLSVDGCKPAEAAAPVTEDKIVAADKKGDDGAEPYPGYTHAPHLIQQVAKYADGLGLPARIPPVAFAYAFIAAIMFFLAFWLKPNANSLHRLYRDRLSKAFFFDPSEGAPFRSAVSKGRDFLPLDDMKLHEIDTLKTPYPLINTTLNVQGSDITNRRGRNGDFFLFSPRYSGSLATCYADTKALEDLAPDLDFPTAVAVSGAAASANMGSKSVRALTPTLALLNVRLGYWLENPHYLAADKDIPLRKRVWVYLYNEITGRLYEDTNLVYLTDGGHIENLGIYELLRRKSELIVVVDGEEDRDMRFTSFITLQRHARIDLGVRIDMPWDLIGKRTRDWMGVGSKSKPEPPEGERSDGPHVAIGTIDYGAEQYGTLVYVKSSLTGDENDYILDYARRYPTFPHESTGDQFFSEEQFEVYRALGFHAMFGFLSKEAEVMVAASILAKVPPPRLQRREPRPARRLRLRSIRISSRPITRPWPPCTGCSERSRSISRRPASLCHCQP